MATYYLWSGASGAGTGADWTNAFTTYTAALAAATADADVIKVHKTHTEELAADTTYTHQNHIEVICVDKDASDALATMGDAAWIGNSTANRAIVMAGAFRVYLYGITLRAAGGSADSFALSVTDGAHFVYESCYLWQGNTAANSSLLVGNADAQSFTHLKNCSVRFNLATARINVASKLLIEGGGLVASGTVPTGGLFIAAVVDSAGPSVECIGFDMSYLGSNPIVGNATTNAFTVRLSQCPLGASFVLLATQTNLNRSSAEVYAFDCASGDTHGLFAYANPMGSVVSDTGIYFTSGAAAQSWKIVTTANCSFYTPFETPWFGYYNTVTTSIAPYVEILNSIPNWAATTAYVIGDRVVNDSGKIYVCDQAGTSAGSGGPTGTGTNIVDNTARWDYQTSGTTYQDDEVWLDVMAKTNTGSTQSALTTDRMTLLGTPANQDAGAGLGSWTGESGTAWSGKLQVASLTPAEVGRLSARVVVGEPSVTVYADPQIRT